MKFRVPQIAMTADIEKAFLQVEISEVNRDATGFLWVKNLQEPMDAEKNIESYRFRRVLFGAFLSPFLLGATLRHHLDKKKDDWVAKDLKNSMYVDDVLSGASNVDDAEHYYRHSRQLSSSAGMNLRQWTTNSSKLKEKLVAENTIPTDKPKVLGLEWDSNADTISFPLMKVMSETKALHDQLTKRSVLSIAAKPFDPLGLLEPFTVRAKIMLQELWKQKVSWDRQLPEELNFIGGHGLRSWKPSRLSKFPDHTLHQDGAEPIYTFSEIPARRPTEQWHISKQHKKVVCKLLSLWLRAKLPL